MFEDAVSRQLNLPLHFVGRFTKAGYPSVESWIEGIAHAKYVITDSFHGTVFSIIFQKQFVTLGNSVRGNSRFGSLFAALGISDERQCNDTVKIVSLFQQHIEYDNVSIVEKNQRQHLSTQFLADAGL